MSKLGEKIDAGVPVATPFLALTVPLSAARQKACAEAYVRRNHLRSPIVVGHSLGGVLAMQMAIAAPEFFRFIWINEVVINDIEVRPLGLDSIEFDDGGAAVLSFVPIRPGEFEYYMPNGGDAYRGKIIVK